MANTNGHTDLNPAQVPAAFGQPGGIQLGQRDPLTNRINWVLPNFGKFPVTHATTFQSIVSSGSKVYRQYDEAIKASLNNARYMRNDCGIMECLEARQRCTALLNWHLEPEDANDKQQKKLCDDIKGILQRIRRFTEYRRNLLEAVWYGKYAVQHLYGWQNVGGVMRMMPKPRHSKDTGWLPINGDKLCFRFDDGHLPEGGYEGQVGIRIGWGLAAGATIRNRWKVEPTDRGMAYFLTEEEAKLLAIHKHTIEDGAYEDPLSAGMIHGVGVRSRIYWEWVQKQETLAFLMEYLERCAGGIQMWKFPSGNLKAKQEVEQAAQEFVGGSRNVILVPVAAGDEYGQYGVETIEPGMAGIDMLKDILTNYFGHRIKRYIMGQVLSSEAESTGLGSGVADAHMDTLNQIIKYDATNLEETITFDLLKPIQEWNFPQFKNVHVRFVIDTEEDDAEDKLKAWQTAYEMGCKLRERDVMELIGAAVPGPDDRVLSLQDQQQQQAQMNQPPGGGMFPGMDTPHGEPKAGQGGPIPPAHGPSDPDAEPPGPDDDGSGGPPTDRGGPSHQYAKKHKPAKGQGELRWITIHAENEGGGTHVQIDNKGNIHAGPAALAEKGIKNLHDFGTKEKPASGHEVDSTGHEVDNLDTNRTSTEPGTDLRPQIRALLKSGKQMSLGDIQHALQAGRHDPQNPLGHPVNAALAKMRDDGEISVHQPKWGDPSFWMTDEQAAKSPESTGEATGDDLSTPISEKSGNSTPEALAEGSTPDLTPDAEEDQPRQFLTAGQAAMQGLSHAQWTHPISSAFTTEQIGEDHPAWQSIQSGTAPTIGEYNSAKNVMGEHVRTGYGNKLGKVTGISDDAREVEVTHPDGTKTMHNPKSLYLAASDVVNRAQSNGLKSLKDHAEYFGPVLAAEAIANNENIGETMKRHGMDPVKHMPIRKAIAESVDKLKSQAAEQAKEAEKPSEARQRAMAKQQERQAAEDQAGDDTPLTRSNYTEKLMAKVKDALANGKTVQIPTRTRITTIKPEHRDLIRLKNGEIQVSQGKQGWLTHGGEALDALADQVGLPRRLDVPLTDEENAQMEKELADRDAERDAEERFAQRFAQHVNEHHGGSLDAHDEAMKAAGLNPDDRADIEKFMEQHGHAAQQQPENNQGATEAQPPAEQPAKPGDNLTGWHRGTFDSLSAAMTRRVNSVNSTRSKIGHATSLMHGEPPAVQQALAQHLKQLSPEAFEEMKAKPPLGLADAFKEPEPAATATEPQATPQETGVSSPAAEPAENLNEYKGPETVVNGSRAAGFSDNPKEIEKAKALGLHTEKVGQWHVYGKSPESVKALAAHLQEHGYGKTLEQKAKLSELAGYSPAQIEEFKRQQIQQMTPEELAAHINSQGVNHLASTTQHDWGTLRGQGKRAGGMVLGGMRDSTLQGKKSYVDPLGKLPPEENQEASSLEGKAKLDYIKARAAGLNHEQGMYWAEEQNGIHPAGTTHGKVTGKEPAAQPEPKPAEPTAETAAETVSIGTPETETTPAEPPAAPAAGQLFEKPATAETPRARKARQAIVQDFGETILARKHEAVPTGPRGKKQKTAEEEADTRPAWARRYSIGENMKKPGEFDIVDTMQKGMFGSKGRFVSHPETGQRTFASKEEAEKAIPLIEARRNHGITNMARKAGEEPNYAIYRKVNDRKHPVVKSGFKSYEEAQEYIKQHPEEIIQHKFPRYEEQQYIDTVNRTGPEKRNRDINEKDFQKDFNFRGGVFGNWQSDKSGQTSLNHAYDAFHDLADLTGLPPKAMALNGQLAMGFGALGTGGKDAARAHYEPDRKVINLTKMKGAGTLSHEWAHALDFHLADLAGFHGPTSAIPGYKMKSGKLRPEMQDAIKKIHDAISGKEVEEAVTAPKQHDEDEVAAMKAKVREQSPDMTDDEIDSNRAFRVSYPKSVEGHLYNLRKSIQDAANWKDRRAGKPEKQLKPEDYKEFDEIANKLKNGDYGKRMYTDTGLETHENVAALNNAYKKLAGHGFHTKADHSPGKDLMWTIKHKQIDKERAAQAEQGVTKRRVVPTDFLKAARELDETRTSDYYTLPEEMFARAFEGYIHDKLEKAGRKSDYLNAKAHNKYYAFGMKPYPEGPERETINAAFDNLFHTMKHSPRTDERGEHVQIYSRGKQLPPASIVAQFDQLLTQMKG